MFAVASRATGADPDPRWPRAAADRRLAGTARRAASSTLIIAHAGIVDLAALARHFGGRSGVPSTRRCGSPLDLLDLYRLVSPEQVLYASDYPYGRQPNSLLMAVRTARVSGLSDVPAWAVLSESARRIADGEAPLPLSPPQGSDEVAQPITFARIHQYLDGGYTALTRQQDTIGLLGLALNARATSARTATVRPPTGSGAARGDPELWTLAAESDDEAFRIRTNRGAFRLLHLANILTVTSSQKLPARARRGRQARRVSRPTAGRSGSPASGSAGSRPRRGCSAMPAATSVTPSPWWAAATETSGRGERLPLARPLVSRGVGWRGQPDGGHELVRPAGEERAVVGGRSAVELEQR